MKISTEINSASKILYVSKLQKLNTNDTNIGTKPNKANAINGGLANNVFCIFSARLFIFLVLLIVFIYNSRQ